MSSPSPKTHESAGGSAEPVLDAALQERSTSGTGEGRAYKETYSDDGPTCPQCGFMFTPDDAYYYEISYLVDTCQECGCEFSVEVHHSVSWECHVLVAGTVTAQSEDTPAPPS